MSLVHIQQAFNGGVFAPFLHNRGDLAKFQSGLREGLNFIATPYGPTRRRPGLIYRENTKTNAKKARVINFDISNDDGYIMEIGEQYVRFYRNRSRIETAGSAWAHGDSYTLGVVVENVSGDWFICTAPHVADDGGTGGSDDGAGDNEPGIGTDAGDFWTQLAANAAGDAGIYEIATPYLEADLFEIQFAQVNDVMYLVHPLHPAKKLTRYGDSEWRFEDLDFTWPPLRAENLDEDFTMAASATTGTVTITASEDFFTADHVGGFLEIGHKRGAGEYEVKKDLTAATAASSAIRIRGEYQIRTVGVSAATITIQESPDNSTWTDVRTIVTSASENFLFTQSTGREFKYVRANHTAGTTGSSSPKVIIEAVDPIVYGLVKITGYSSATSVTATVSSRLYDTAATERWSEGAFSDHRGHARTVTLHELRLIFGGTDTDRQSLWFSQSDDFPNFEQGTLDTDGIAYQLASTEHSRVNWLVSQKQLVIGTTGGEWVFDSGRDEQVITPSNRRARRHSTNGSDYRQALPVGSSSLFTLSGGERIGDLNYIFAEDNYVADDLNMLSYDLTRGGIKQLAFQKKRFPLIWAAIEGEGLACMTYNKRQEVTGWNPVKSPGDSGTDVIESVAVIGRPGDEDEVWCVVKRTINGFVVRYIESLDSDSFDKQEDAAHYDTQQGLTADTGTNLEDLVFVDSAYVATGADLSVSAGDTTVGGLDHLVGADVIAYADGSREGGLYTVSGAGEIVLAGVEPSKVIVGLPYKSRARTLPFFNSLETGSTRGRETVVEKAVILMHRSTVFDAGVYDDPNGLQEVPTRSTDIAEGDPTPLRDGEIEITLGGRHSLDPSFVIETDEPGPLTLEALILKFSVHGDR